MILVWLIVLIFYCKCQGLEPWLPPLTIIRDPDIGRNAPEFIKSRGFLCETHRIVTADGYILTAFRIVNKRFSPITRKRTVVLHHGLMLWSNDFINNSPGGNFDEPVGPGIPVGNNLGFELAKRGYDVWLPNTRGTAYSRNHTYLPIDSFEYWNFSLDEFIAYDVPAVVKYILRQTGKKSIAWVGHSQGNTIVLGLLSRQQEYSQLIKPFILLAPSYTVAVPGTIPIALLCDNIPVPQVMYHVGGKFLPDTILRPIAQRACAIYYPGSELCLQFIFSNAGGYFSYELNTTRMPVYLGYESYGSSTKNLAQRCQQMASGRFDMFDYLPEGNLKKYGTKSPPEYDVSRITSRHMTLISSLTDRIGDAYDVQLLRQRLTVPFEDYIVPVKFFAHLDFLWGMRAGELVYTKVLQVLDRYPS